jgi:hypothetical protein
MKNIALLGDIHLGIKNGNHIFHEYLTNKVEEILYSISKTNITDVYFLGDFFDNRRAIPVNIINWAMTTFPNLLFKYRLTAHILTGNHDVYYLTSNKYSSLDLFNGFDNINIYKSPITIDNITLIPWINKENINDTIELLKNTDENNYVLGHFELNGFKMYHNSITYNTGIDLSILSKFNHVYSGHFHHQSNKGNIDYIGSIATLTRSDIFDINKKGWYNLDLINNKHILNLNRKSIFKEYVYTNEIDLTQLKLTNRHIDFVIEQDYIVDDVIFQKFKQNLSDYKILSYKINDMRDNNIEISENTSDNMSNNLVKTTRDYLMLRIEDLSLNSNTAEYLLNLHDKCLNEIQNV